MSTQAKFANPFWCFTLGGFALHVATVTVWHIGDLVWVDFIHVNPNRSQSNALAMMALSPVYGILFALIFSWLPLLVGTIGALAAYRVWGRVPLWSLFVMLPLCVCAICVEAIWMFPPEEPSDEWPFLWKFL